MQFGHSNLNISDNFLLVGRNTPPPEQIHLQAGPVSVIYEDGALRSFFLAGTEVLRMIYHAVRDPDWNTVIPDLKPEQFEKMADRFAILYTATYKGYGIEFEAGISFRGEKDGSITCSMKGLALNTFQKNRIGFCILHPVHTCMGKEVLIGHTDGTIEKSVFPVLVSPHQPFFDIAFMEYKPEKDLMARIDFEGDVFETEDQRNWTDASYKTYSTPLALPFPVTMKRGTVIEQNVRFSLTKISPKVFFQSSAKQPVHINLTEQTTPFPAIGLLQSSRYPTLSESECSLLKKLKIDHLRVDLSFVEKSWKEKFSEANLTAKQLNVPLFLSLAFSDHPENDAASFIEIYAALSPKIDSVLIVDEGTKVSNSEWFAPVRKLFKEKLNNVSIGAGTNAYFAEFNRNKPFPGEADFFAWSVNPQVHAFDYLTLVENLQAQADTVISARTFQPGIPLWVTPVTLKPRFNPVATRTETSGINYPSPPDPRQMSLFTAGWLVGSLKYLAEAGASKITFFETTGEKGLIQGPENSLWPADFPSHGGMIFPVFFVLNELLRYSQGRVMKTMVSQPDSFSALTLLDGIKNVLVLASHTPKVINVLLPFPVTECSVRILDLPFCRNNMFSRGTLPDLPVQVCRPDKGVLELQPFTVVFVEIPS